MKKIFFKTIIIVLFLFVSINIIETYSHNQDEYGVDYFSNVKKSIEDYQLVYKIVFMETMQLENKEYTRFIDIYAGAYLDDYGFLNVLFIDDADNISLIENTKKQILASTRNDSIRYESASYSYNYLQDILNYIEPVMLKFDIIAVGIDDKLNKVFIELSTNHKYDIENYLMEIGCFENSILFYYSETTDISANSCVSHGGESIYHYIDDDTVSCGTIGAIAVNNTGQIGVITNEHVAPLSTTMFYGGHTTVSSGLVNFSDNTMIGTSTTTHHGGTVDAAFIPYQDQIEWEFTPYSKYSTTIFNNVRLGAANQIVRGQPVLRIGQTTGITTGEIRSTNVTATIDGITLNDLFRYTNDGLGGDSGGPVYYNDGSNLFLIGLHCASGDVLFGGRQGNACKIANVINQLNVSIITNDSFNSTDMSDGTIQLDGISVNALENINIPTNIKGKIVTAIGVNAFKNKTNIKNVIIPNTVTSIGSSAFDGCTNLESVTLSSSLQTIGSFAFKGCTSLEEIEIPSSVNSIGANAFKLCASLESVTIKKEQSPITTIGLNAFMSCLNLSEIKVPDNRIADYINNVNWSGYSSLIVPENNNYATYYLGSSPINASTYLNAGYNKLYKLVVTSSNTYYINSTSNNNITTKLYDSNYQLLNTSNGLISRYLNSGATYYLSVEYNNPSWIGTIYTNITTDSSHQHSYTYVWNSYTKHTKQCLCGDSSLKSHVVDANAFNNGQQYATCMVCGGLASVGINPRSNNNYPYTLNGSFILPNGVIVLVSEDYEAYMNDTLVFINPNDNIDRGNTFIPCLIRKEDNYWSNVS